MKKLKYFTSLNKINKNSNLVITYTLLIFLIIFLSCTSPLDVPANRKKLETGTKQEIIDIVLSTDEMQFGFVSYTSTKTIQFKITNNSKKDAVIDSIKAKNHPDMFYFYGDDIFPVKIASGKSKEYMILFNAKELGEFSDVITLNGWDKYSIKCEAKVPYVEARDLNFNEYSILSPSPRPKGIIIFNNSNVKITINTYKLIDPENSFFITDSIKSIDIDPVNTPFGTNKAVINIAFIPRMIKAYNARVEFDITAPSNIIKNVAELSGVGRQ
ncbi:MAG: hypothetical protein HW421_2432 [Ignavibacteria bacterium]|nr:hypothetical protein [Ignavibacteria bacterium]